VRGGARAGTAALAAILAALALGSCGGSGAGDSAAGTSAPAGSRTETTGSEPAPAGATSESASAPGSSGSSSPATSAGPGSSSGAPLTRASARRAEHRAEAVQAARHRALTKKAGAAAPFLVAQGDNSIPTYGSQASGSELSEATASLSSYLQARAAGDWARACSLMSASVAKQVALLGGEAGAGKPSCGIAYAKLSERVPAPQRVSPLTGGLAALRVEADKAFALFYGPREQQYMMPMVSEGGTWKANQIEPIPYPIGGSGG
jgi:hypothetical protein